MSETDSETATHRTIADDAEFNAVFTATTAGDGRAPADWDSAVCTECERGDKVETESRTRGLVTVKRHTCTRCGTHGATVVEGGVKPSDAKLWTKGDVITVDLEQPENERYRGTF